jgi:hypothetical protein
MRDNHYDTLNDNCMTIQYEDPNLNKIRTLIFDQ